MKKKKICVCVINKACAFNWRNSKETPSNVLALTAFSNVSCSEILAANRDTNMVQCTSKKSKFPTVKSRAIRHNRYVFCGLWDKKHNRQHASALIVWLNLNSLYRAVLSFCDDKSAESCVLKLRGKQIGSNSQNFWTACFENMNSVRRELTHIWKNWYVR
jgi:hypothetical protein